jgi:hypothetical protein
MAKIILGRRMRKLSCTGGGRCTSRNSQKGCQIERCAQELDVFVCTAGRHKELASERVRGMELKGRGLPDRRTSQEAVEGCVVQSGGCA